jgi:hypothetical protein
MSRAWDDERRILLRALSNLGDWGRAEGVDKERTQTGFYPVADHLRLLDPEVVLVIGPRGSGKTSIEKVLTDNNLFDAVKAYAPAVRLPEGETQWLRAYPTERKGFEGIGMRAFIEKVGDATDALRDFWFAYLVRLLRDRFSDSVRAELTPLFEKPAADTVGVYQAFRALGVKPVVAVDGLDEQLAQQGRYVFVTYDALDILGNGDWKLIEAGVRGLVAFWAAYARRWRHLRAKLFLRTDLFERHAKAGGGDLAKLAAGRVELTWSDRDLYALLLKRMANGDPSLARYVQDVKGVMWREDSTLGRIPALRTWQDARPVVERMVGPYMGANQKKGLVYRWLLDHVRDGQGRAYPRPLVRLFEEAARNALTHFHSLDRPKLLEPSSLRRSLDDVSRNHVMDVLDEWPWLEMVKEKLRENSLIPYSEKEASRLLAGFPQGQEGKQPPFEARDLIDYLVELGIFRRRPDGRLDVPDLYLAGLGLKRKGGVKKK